VALVKGAIDASKPTLVRMHQLSLFADAFGEEGGRGGLLRGAMKIIGEEGSGVIVVLNRAMPDALSAALNLRSGKAPARGPDELRDYGGGAQILSALGVHDMVLLTNTHHTPVALGGYGLTIVGERPIPLEE
jgi:3,4-dihydroxy 2-butanone 4-phosphate synthase/GTP cyclohydrolase II